MIKKKYSKKFVDECKRDNKSFITNEGYEAKVIDYGSKGNYCTIQINDWIAEVQVVNLKNGEVKYPFHPSVFGHGYLGVGEYKPSLNGKNTIQYQQWNDMLRRTYDPKLHKRNPTYKDVTVIDEWLNFQTFAKWMDEQTYKDKYNKYDLDKDLLFPNNKVYSPDKCVFLPQRINSFLTYNKSTNTSSYAGVDFDKRCGKFRARCMVNGKRKHLGLFADPEDASKAYKPAKEKEAKRLANEYKAIIPYEVYEALMNFIV